MRKLGWWWIVALGGLASMQQFAGCAQNGTPPADEIVNYCAVFDCVDGALGGVIQWCSPELRPFNDCP
jgi:hypothetical protein